MQPSAGYTRFITLWTGQKMPPFLTFLKRSLRSKTWITYYESANGYLYVNSIGDLTDANEKAVGFLPLMDGNQLIQLT